MVLTLQILYLCTALMDSQETGTSSPTASRQLSQILKTLVLGYLQESSLQQLISCKVVVCLTLLPLIKKERVRHQIISHSNLDSSHLMLYTPCSQRSFQVMMEWLIWTSSNLFQLTPFSMTSGPGMDHLKQVVKKNSSVSSSLMDS